MRCIILSIGLAASVVAVAAEPLSFSNRGEFPEMRCQTEGSARPSFLWDEGIIPYEILDGFTAEALRDIRRAIDH